MIVGGRIDEVTGKKNNEEAIKGLNIDIMLEDVKVDGENIEIKYKYTARYEDDVGEIAIRGLLATKEEKGFAKEIASEWKAKKKVPEAFAETILNAINYSGSANGTLIARVVNLSPPLVPPRISLQKK